MPDPTTNLVIACLMLFCILILFGCIVLVHWSNWKRMKAAKVDALKREVQSYRVLESERPVEFAGIVKRVYSKGTACPRLVG